jgi:hypothetical protein
MSAFDPNAIYEELHRVTASQHLCHSSNLQRFLRFVVEEELAGRGEEIKETLIAIEVFHRSDNFDPRLDSIVRVQATMLRKKLAAYYANEGANSPIQIELAKGRYVPSFQARQTITPLLSSPARRPGASRVFLAAAVSCALLTLAIFGFRSLKSTSGSTIWSTYFRPNARTVIVYGTPQFFSVGGLFLRDVNVNSAAAVEPNSAIAAWHRAAKNAGPISTDSSLVYTGIGEAFAVQKISRHFWENSRRPEVRLNNDFSLEDTQNSNLILVSSMRFRTFLDEFQFPADFTHVPSPKGNGEAVLNAHPGPSESQFYCSSRPTQSPETVEYALISLWPWRNADHRILVLSGTTTYATQAAAEFVTDPVALSQLEDKLRATGHPSYFQCLLRVYLNQTHVTKVEYVTHHGLNHIPSLVARNNP